MSIFWDRKSYTSFKYTLHNKFTAREKLCWHWYPCPGFVGHRHPRREILFEHFHRRPQKSWLVYWRSHPIEWKEILLRTKRQTVDQTV
jgi:hypothetical protein